MAYKLHKQFSKEQEDPKNNKDDDKTGTKFRSIFKIETRDVFKNDKGGANGGAQANGQGGDNDKKGEEPDKVERFTIVDQAKKRDRRRG